MRLTNEAAVASARRFVRNGLPLVHCAAFVAFGDEELIILHSPRKILFKIS